MLHFSTWKTSAILATIVIGLWLAVPNLMPVTWREAMPSWLPHRAVTLGLDLQGGSHLLLEVDQNAIVKEQVETLRDDVRRTLRDARIGYTNLGVQGRSVQLTLRDPADRQRALDLLRPLGNPANAGLFGGADQRTVDVAAGDAADNAKVTLTVTDAGTAERLARVLDRSIDIVRRRVDELGTTEPLIQRQGADRILVQLPGLQDPSRFKDILGKTAKLEFRLVDTTVSPDQAQSRPPPDSEVLQSQDGQGASYVVQKRSMVSGEDLVGALASFDQQNREPVVSFRFNTRGAQQFGRVTQENVNRPFAIVLDNKVISAPVIREPILGGSGQISGNFTTQSANDLALLLRSGALPAPLTVVEERTVGPGLGQDSIHAGALAAFVGSALVVAFMCATYGLFGVIA